jgi:hypothetical protein
VQFFNRVVDLDEILYGDDDIKDDLDSMLFNPVASPSPKGAPFEPIGGIL